MSPERQIPDHSLSPTVAPDAMDSAVGRPLIGATWGGKYPRVCQWHARTRRWADTGRQGTPWARLHLRLAPPLSNPPPTPTTRPLLCPSPSLPALWKQHHVPDTESMVTIHVSRRVLFTCHKCCVCVWVCMGGCLRTCVYICFENECNNYELVRWLKLLHTFSKIRC